MRNKKKKWKKEHVQIRQVAMKLLVLLYNKKTELLLPLCVPLQREQYMVTHCVKPIKIQPRHIASSLPSHVVNMLLSHHSCQCTCVHCIKYPPLLATSQISQHHISLSVSRIPWVEIQGGRVECEQNRGNFTLTIHLQYKGQIWKQEMSYEHQACMLMVPVATSLRIEIK